MERFTALLHYDHRDAICHIKLCNAPIFSGLLMCLITLFTKRYLVDSSISQWLDVLER